MEQWNPRPNQKRRRTTWSGSEQGRAQLTPKILKEKEHESDFYNEKLLMGAVKVRYLPKGACGLHGWLRDIFTQLGPLDRSEDGVLAKPILFYIHNGYRQRLCAEEAIQGGLPRFSKHMAKQ